MIDLTFTRRTIVGAGNLSFVPGIVREEGGPVFIVSTRSFYNSPRRLQLLEGLKSERVSTLEAVPVSDEPTIEIIDAAAEKARSFGAKAILSIGGGSALDTGKAVAMLLTNGGSIREYQMEGKPVTKRAAFHIAVPTTAGTGSEANAVSVVTNNQAKVKKSVRQRLMVPDVAILDASLTVGLSQRFTALTAMDALSHAAESYVSTSANSYTESASLKAIELISEALPRAIEEPHDIPTREALLIAAYLAGFSLNAGGGAMHILAQPVSAVMGLRHSEAIAALLVPVFRFNEGSTPKMKKVAEILGGPNAAEGATRLLRKASLEAGKKLELEKEKVTAILEAVKKSTSHNIATNPRPVTEKDLEGIIGETFHLI